MNKSLRKILFLSCYAIFLFDVTFRHTDTINELAHFLLNFISMPILCLLIVDNLNGLTRKRALAVISVVAVGVSSRLITNDNTLMLACILICAFKDIDFKNVILFSLILKCVFLITLLALFYMNLTDATIYIREDGIVRYTYGFSNINGFGAYVFSIIIQFLYLDGKSIRLRDALVVLTGIIIINIFTASKTPMLILSILLIYIVYTIIKQKSHSALVLRRKLSKFFVVHSFIIMALISLFAYVGYVNNNQAAKDLNKLTSGRISSVHTLVEMNGISMFGQEVDRSSGSSDDTRRVLDNSYAYLVLYYGPIMLCIIAYIYRKGIETAIAQKNDACAAFIALYNVAGLMEHFSLEVSINPFLLTFSNMLYYKTPRQSRRRSLCH